MWPTRMCISWIRRRDARGHDDGGIAQRAHRPAVPADEAGRAQPWRRASRSAASTLGLRPEVEMPTATSPGAAEGFDLAAEDRLEAEIVGAGGEGRGIRRQRDGCDRGRFCVVADHQLGGDVLRIAGAAAIAEDQQLAAGAQRTVPHLQRGPKGSARELMKASNASRCSSASLSRKLATSGSRVPPPPVFFSKSNHSGRNARCAARGLRRAAGTFNYGSALTMKLRLVPSRRGAATGVPAADSTSRPVRGPF